MSRPKEAPSFPVALVSSHGSGSPTSCPLKRGHSCGTVLCPLLVVALSCLLSFPCHLSGQDLSPHFVSPTTYGCFCYNAGPSPDLFVHSQACVAPPGPKWSCSSISLVLFTSPLAPASQLYPVTSDHVSPPPPMPFALSSPLMSFAGSQACVAFVVIADTADAALRCRSKDSANMHPLCQGLPVRLCHCEF